MSPTPEPEQLAAIAVEAAELLLISTDAGGRIEVFSGACERLTGLAEAEVRGRVIWELIAFDDERASLRSAFAGALETLPETFVAHWHDASGELRVLIWASRKLRSPEGTIVRAVFTGVDVTERERIESKLLHTGARHERLLDQLPALHWTTDRSLRFTSGGGAALAELGLRPGQMDGVSLFTFFGTDREDAPQIAPSLRALEGETTTFEAAWAGRSFQVVTKPLRDENGDIIGTVGVALDVTERLEAERQRDQLLVAEREARAEAERALELRDEFLSIASHELSTPMTSLQLALDALASGEATGDIGHRLIESAAVQAARLRRLIGELLEVSRIQAGRLAVERRDMDLVSVVREVVSRLEPLAQRAACALEVRAPSELRGVWDPDRIDQVVSNLVENAIKHAAGTPITVSLEAAPDEAVLEVSDRGPGIPPERLPYIFDRFARATSARHRGGLGLGLYLVHQLVKAHGGEVRAESASGAGTTLRVRLPRGDPHGEDLPAAANESPEPGPI